MLIGLAMVSKVNKKSKKRIVVAITGASGSIYGVTLLKVLQDLPDWESHLVISSSGALTAQLELGLNRAKIEAMADVVHKEKNIGASIASGSFQTEGMIIAPCSMRTLASIANGLSDNLVSRAADVALKERQRVVLMVRETPLNRAHLKNMLAATEMGAIICPPVPAFYSLPKSIDDIVAHTIGRVLDLFDIETDKLVTRWEG